MSETSEKKTDPTGEPENPAAETVESETVETTGAEAATSAPVTTKRGLLATAKGVLKTARPRQWVKNILVFAAPFTSGQIGNASVLVDAAVAFVAFSLVASSVYLINDAIDVEADRAHPTKSRRPIAAGIVPVPLAYGAAAVFFLAGMAVGTLAHPSLLIVLAVYEAIQLGYCFGLKHQPVIDLAIVGSGFLMRAIAGGVAAGITLSQWFLLVTAFGSLFMVAGKRYAEIILFERTGAKIRSSLKKYSASYLRFVWATSAAVLIMTYCLWAFELQQRADGSVWPVISVIPFVVAVLRYAVDVDAGTAGEPEEIVLKDRILQVLGVAWIASLAIGYYLFKL
ncbi:decaprenyl-phosphate phosphoribosyltransferase [Amycolatopsis suaedae]|uniref:Decaprenyl-phosphate phosphoribosyltransferase n=1 Tax=Amycolatopsis suaedae TaxID=2510978 RepID=A0A4Q7J7M2_9PSEU|nr:decaprenyl-phosphate phosphoribosyltransferase [Amycolatopsis suaedae]RZQ62044.1 decaprenyl-phosphate phosphoribosyltransferase [Amycolatopsis suaedae]